MLYPYITLLLFDTSTLCRCLMRFHTELYTFVRLQDFNDHDDIVGTGIAARPAHKLWDVVAI